MALYKSVYYYYYYNRAPLSLLSGFLILSLRLQSSRPGNVEAIRQKTLIKTEYFALTSRRQLCQAISCARLD